MDTESGLKVVGNFNLNPAISWNDLPLSAFFRNKISSLNIKMYPTHKYCLGPLLNGESMLVTSPSGTYRSTLSMIGIIHLLDLSLLQLQAIVIIPRKTLIDEYSVTFENYSSGLGINTVKLIGGEKFNKKELEKAQVAICSTGKLISMIENKNIKLNDLKIVVLDVASGLFYRDIKLQTDKILALLPNDAIYWYLSPVSDEVVTESYLKKKPSGKIIDIIDERVMHSLKFYSKFYEDHTDLFGFIEKRIQNFSGQIIIYSCEIEDLLNVSEFLQKYSPVLIHDGIEDLVKENSRKDFKEGHVKILICHGIYRYARKINTASASEIFNIDIPDPELLLARVRRAAFNADDKCFCFFKCYEDSMIKELQIQKNFTFIDADLL